MAYIFITTKEKTNWKYILIIVILALIVIAETFYLLKQEEKIPEIKLPEKVVKDETADWKTYRNEEYGFEIKYPEDGILTTERRIDFPSPSIHFEIGNITVSTGKYLTITDECVLGPTIITEEEIQIEKTEFLKRVIAEVAAGTTYNSITYQPLKKPFCPNFIFTHPLSLGVFYPQIPEGYAEKYSQWVAEEYKQFEEFAGQLLSTFRFLE